MNIVEMGTKASKLALSGDRMDNFEIWDTETNSEDHNMKDVFWKTLYISKDDFEDMQDIGYEFRYVYSGHVLNTFDEFVDYVVNG